MGLNPVPAGHVAAVVTSLEMRKRPLARPLPDAPFRLAPWKEPALDKYRILFRRVGAPWLWFSRLVIDDNALRTVIHDPQVEIFAMVDREGIEIGVLELDFREPQQCEIAFFGMIPELASQGHGRWLMAQTLGLAWRKGIERVWVHTCSLDHPRALGFYRAQGFVPFARAIETFPDPRIAGYLPRDAAAHIPLIEA